jgi:hypothetical protein
MEVGVDYSDLRDFTEIRAGYAFQLEITRSEDYSVVIEVPEEMRDDVRVSVEGGALRIGLAPRHVFWPFGHGRLSARISLPVLDALDLSGASHATAGGFESDRDVRITVSGASFLDAGLRAGTVTIHASGGSQCRLSGGSQSAVVHASGGSHIDLAEFGADNVRVDLSGGSHASVDAREQLDCSLSGGSHLRYTGRPRFGRNDVSGASSVTAA